MREAILAGVFTLVGIVLGAVLADVRERRRDRRSVRAAARLVQEEFVEGITSAWTAVYLPQKNEPVAHEIVVEEGRWLEHQAKLAEALDGSEWSDLTWAAKHRREFIDWLKDRRRGGGIFADDLTQMEVGNLTFWGNKGWDALAKAAGIPWWKRRSIKGMRAREREEQAKLDASRPEA